jgi:hypothetical protein
MRLRPLSLKDKSTSPRRLRHRQFGIFLTDESGKIGIQKR